MRKRKKEEVKMQIRKESNRKLRKGQKKRCYPKQQNTGITLIALVVTLVVLLILAGITIVYLMGDNGIIQKASDSKVEIKKAKYEEVLKIIELGLQPERKLNNWSNQKYMDKFEEKIRGEDIFEDAKQISQLSYTEKITIQVITKEEWVYWITEDNIEYKVELPPEEPEVKITGIFAVLKDNGTLEFYTTKEKADKVDGKHYEDMKGKVIIRDANEETTDAPWFVDKDQITAVKFVDEVAPEYLGYYFSDLKNLENIDMSRVKTHNVTNMEGLFLNCEKLKSINTQGWVTKNVTNMEAMFLGCLSLTNLDISMFDTSKVTNMKNMFFALPLTNIDVSSFNTSNVTNMQGMFARSNLQQLDLSNFDTSNVTNMINMFYDCNSLTKLDLSSFNTSNVTSMSYMFVKCRQLTSLDLSSFNIKSVATMEKMFFYSENLKNIYVGKDWIINSETIQTDMFTGCGTEDVTIKQ